MFLSEPTIDHGTPPIAKATDVIAAVPVKPLAHPQGSQPKNLWAPHR